MKQASQQCSVTACTLHGYSRGMCRKHYGAWYYQQTMEKDKAGKKAYNADLSNKRKAYDRQLRSNYGITIDQYDGMLAQQGGVCAICKAPPGERRLHVDHCHKTGIIRGILCSGCNTGIGNFKEDCELLKTAIMYLRVNE